MSEILEQQSEEREALQSIYEGDENFKEVNPVTYQYKYGEDNTPKSFVVEVKWTENYPNEIPIINLDAFYNRHIVPSVKECIITALKDEAENWLGCGMTFTLFESIKDRVESLTSEQPEKMSAAASSSTADLENQMGAIKISENTEDKRKEPKKEQLTKAQKRRQWERTDHKGERARGWNWVDIVKHLSQTGGKNDQEPAGSSTPSTSNEASYSLQPLNG